VAVADLVLVEVALVAALSAAAVVDEAEEVAVVLVGVLVAVEDSRHPPMLSMIATPRLSHLRRRAIQLLRSQFMPAKK